MGPRRPGLILGDSNITRFLYINDGLTQGMSYPGARLEKAINLLRNKSPTSPAVKNVILAFGLNNRRDGDPTLLRKWINTLVSVAEQTFPCAKVVMPVMNLVQRWLEKKRKNLGILNNVIKETGKFVPPLPDRHFATAADGVHWSEATAEAMALHWLKF